MRHAPRGGRSRIDVRPLRDTDRPAAALVLRRAFGTFLGAADPDRFMADRDYVGSRWPAGPDASFAAVADGEIVGSNFLTRWGSVGFFGPLTVTPERWDQGVATRLLEPTLARFDEWGLAHAGLYTFPQSAKHVGLYQRFGFWPRALTAVMSRPVRGPGTVPTLLSALPEEEREAVVADCRTLTGAIYDGLDVEPAIRAVATRALGETVLVRDGDRVAAFAVCHCGAGSEAGTGVCYVKFGAVRPGPGAAARFGALLDGCVALAHARGLTQVDAGVSLAREQAFEAMRAAGFRIALLGVCMHRPNEPGYHRPGVYVIDDWR